jgi:hypothetical protein
MLEMPSVSNFKTNRYLKRLLVFAAITFILLFGLMTMTRSQKSIGTSSQSRIASNQSMTHTPFLKFDPQWDDFAIAVKTGSEVALQRVPIQLLTFLSDVRNKIIIGDGPNVTVGDYEMIDVYTHLYDGSKPSIKKSKSFSYLIFKGLLMQLFLMKTLQDGNRTHTKTCQD